MAYAARQLKVHKGLADGAPTSSLDSTAPVAPTASNPSAYVVPPARQPNAFPDFEATLAPVLWRPMAYMAFPARSFSALSDSTALVAPLHGALLPI